MVLIFIICKKYIHVQTHEYNIFIFHKKFIFLRFYGTTMFGLSVSIDMLYKIIKLKFFIKPRRIKTCIQTS
jgi:hypothetical protein